MERTRACAYLENESYHPSFQQPKYYAPMEGFAAVRVREELEAVAKDVCWQADTCHERGVHTVSCDKIRKRLEELSNG